MWKVLLQPCGDSDANKHFVDTIETPVPVADIVPLLSAQEVSDLSPIFQGRTAIPTWGVTPGQRDVNVRKWDRVHPGDCALFSRDGRIFATASVAGKTRNERLAERLWQRNADKETWECMYFLDEVKYVDIPYKDFNAAVGYQPNYVIQGFNVLDPEKSAKLDAAFDLHSTRHVAPESREGANDDVMSRFEGVESLDVSRVGRTRREQAYLRSALLGRNNTARCCLCGEVYPVDMIVIAHIKKRALCTKDEQLDFDHIAAPMCLHGCDALFELGYVAVDETGTIRKGISDIAATGLDLALARVLGRTCGHWSAGSSKYFAWHRGFHGVAT